MLPHRSKHTISCIHGIWFPSRFPILFHFYIGISEINIKSYLIRGNMLRKNISLSIEVQMCYPLSRNASVKQSWPQSYNNCIYNQYLSQRKLLVRFTPVQVDVLKTTSCGNVCQYLVASCFSGFVYQHKWSNNHNPFFLPNMKFMFHF